MKAIKGQVTINGVVHPLCISFKAMRDFEAITYKQIAEATTTEDNAILGWCALKSGANKEKIEFKQTLEEWYDMLDDDFSILQDVSNAIIEMSEAADPKKKKAKRATVKAKN